MQCSSLSVVEIGRKNIVLPAPLFRWNEVGVVSTLCSGQRCSGWNEALAEMVARWSYQGLIMRFSVASLSTWKIYAQGVLNWGMRK